MDRQVFLVNCTIIPPIAVPMAPPIGAPAANVANAMVRAREGGKACARIPREAGIVAAAPTPWKPLRISRVIAVLAKETPKVNTTSHTAPKQKTFLRP